MFAVRPGIVGIRGVKSERYLCMNQEGIAHGMVRKVIRYTRHMKLNGKTLHFSKSPLTP